jgi:hypothetical protein
VPVLGGHICSPYQLVNGVVSEDLWARHGNGSKKPPNARASCVAYSQGRLQDLCWCGEPWEERFPCKLCHVSLLTPPEWLM